MIDQVIAFKGLNTRPDKHEIEPDEMPAETAPSRAEVLGFSEKQREVFAALLLDVMGAERQRVDREMEDLRQRTVADVRAAILRNEKHVEGLMGAQARRLDEMRARYQAQESRWSTVEREYSTVVNALNMMLQADTTRAQIEKRFGADFAEDLVRAIHGKVKR